MGGAEAMGGGVRGPLRWTSLVGAGLSAYVWTRAERLRDVSYWRLHTARVQAAQLRGLLKKAAGTEYGREHGFARIAAIDDDAGMIGAYRRAVPVRDWYAFKGRIERMREGAEPGVLWPGLVKRFAQTSGTTAGDKFIPVSDEMMRSNFRASLDIFAHLMNQGVSATRFMGGRCLFLGGSSDLEPNEHGIVTADLSGLVAPMIRWPLSAIYSPGPKIALMDDWPKKIEAMAELTAGQDIRFISGMPSWALVLMERVLEVARARGGRASCIRDVWPNLSVFVHGGVRYEPFRPRVARMYSGQDGVDIPHRFELYPASEAFIAMQDGPNRLDADGVPVQPGLRLLTDNGVFFEFVPLERIDDANPEAVSCWEVRPGQRYVVVLTTCAGLWRYVIGDVVEFDSVPGGLGGGGVESPGREGPCRLRIVGRHRQFINAFGENIIVEHVERAVAEAARATGIVVGEFTAAPVYPDGARRAAVQLAVEVEGKPGEAELMRFAEAFDAGIKAVNVDYTTKRGAGVGMVGPTVTPVPLGTFHRWMDARGKLGGQRKVPRCANHREIIEGVVGAAGGVE